MLDNTRIHDFSGDDFQYFKKHEKIIQNSECNNPDKHFCQTTMKKKVDGQESKNLNNQGPEWKSCTVRTAEKVGISVLHVFSEIKNVKEKIHLSSIWLSSRAKRCQEGPRGTMGYQGCQGEPRDPCAEGSRCQGFKVPKGPGVKGSRCQGFHLPKDQGAKGSWC